MAHFSQTLCKLRTSNDLTQTDFGAIVNLSKQTISGYETGDIRYQVKHYEKYQSECHA